METKYEFHSHHIKFLSNYLRLQPSWPGNRLSLLARESTERELTLSRDGGYFFFEYNAPLSAYTPPHRRLHDGSVLILTNT